MHPPSQQPDQIRSRKQSRPYHAGQTKQPFHKRPFIQRKIARCFSGLTVYDEKVVLGDGQGQSNRRSVGIAGLGMGSRQGVSDCGAVHRRNAHWASGLV